MENIPTAEEFANENYGSRLPRGVSYYKEIGELMIEFAKLHVQNATTQILMQAEVELFDKDNRSVPTKSYRVNSDSIVKAYPLTNIK